MPKHPALTDTEIRATLEAYRGHHGRWPTNKEARNVLHGPAANERLARILSNLRQQAEPAVSPRPADDGRTRRERLKAVFDDMTDEIGGPRLVAYEILRTDFMAAIEETRQDCLASDMAWHRTLQEKLCAAEMAQRNFLSAHEDLRQTYGCERIVAQEPMTGMRAVQATTTGNGVEQILPHAGPLGTLT